jgi:hypothetical protein
MKAAYKVTGEEGDVIVFAESVDDAAQVGAFHLADAAEYVSVELKPDYDQYSELGYVPAEILIRDGWYFFCLQCESRVDSSFEDEDGEPVLPEYEGRHVFCCEMCQSQYHHDRKHEDADRAASKADMEQRYPGITRLSVYGGGDYSVYVQFHFPGGKHAVSWDSSKSEYVMVSPVDVPAWQAFAEQAKLARGEHV